MGEGSTEFLLSLFDGADDDLDQFDDEVDAPNTSGGASSSSWMPPPAAGRGLGMGGRRPKKKATGRGRSSVPPPFDEPLDGLDDDPFDDDLFFDEDSMEMMDGPFSDEDLDDPLGFPSLRPEHPERIVHRFNPYGTLQLPPVRRLRAGFIAEDVVPAGMEGQLVASPARGRTPPSTSVDCDPSPLFAMEKSALRKMAEELGASDMDLAKAIDADDTKAALIEIICRLQKQVFANSQDQSTARSQIAGTFQNHQHSTSSMAAPARTEEPDTSFVQSAVSDPPVLPSPVSAEMALVPARSSEKPHGRLKRSGHRASSDDGHAVACGRLKRLRDEDDPEAMSGLALEDKTDRKKKSKAQVELMSEESTGPTPPKFAFEWFRESCADSIAELPVLIQQWKSLPDAERAEFVQKAEQDRERFEKESATLSQPDLREGNEDLSLEDLVVPRQGEHEKSRRGRKSKCSASSSPAHQRRQARKTKEKKPDGYPASCRTSYSIFCAGRKLTLSSQPKAEAASDGTKELEGSKSSGVSALKQYRAAWDGLSVEEKESYHVRATADQQRFRDELESWLAGQPDGGLGEAADMDYRTAAKKILARPIVPQGARVPRLQPEGPPVDENSMAAVLLGASKLKAPPEPKSTAAPALKEGTRPSMTNGEDGYGSRSLVPQPADDDDDDLWAAFGVEGSGGDSSGHGGSMAETPGVSSQDFGALPTPRGAPAAFGPSRGRADVSVDDLLAEFGEPDQDGPAENDVNNPPEAAYEEEFALAHWQDPSAMYPETPEATGAPQVLGPQLCIDESGNIVLNQSSLSKKMDSTHRPEDMAGPAVEQVGHYKQAYRKTAATKWTDEETAQFYEALAIYGTDLFLVQTFFRNKSAAQIKSKYGRELKRNPRQVEEALTTTAKKLTKVAFEKQHGKIDTTKHYQPQPTPEPGDEPEPDGALPDPHGPAEPEAPPEPEYTAEDESLTTERLMALFD